MAYETYSPIVIILAFSGKIVLESCAANLILGVGFGVYLAQHRGKRFCTIVDILVTLPLVFPPIGLGFFLILLFGRNGVIGKGLDQLFNIGIVFSSLGVFLAAFIASFPLMLKSVQTSTSSLDPSILEMAALQGANKRNILFLIILPNIKPGLISGLTLAIGRTLGEVGITLMLGGNIIGKTETISLAIYNAVFEGDFSKAAVLSVLLAVFSACLFFVIQRSAYEKGSK